MVYLLQTAEKSVHACRGLFMVQPLRMFQNGLRTCGALFVTYPLVLVAFSSHARILGECSTIYSPPALFFFFFLSGD